MECIVYTCEEGILSVKLPFIGDGIYKYSSISRLIPRMRIKAVGPHPLGNLLAHEIREYLLGKSIGFSDYPLVQHRFTAFQKKVWACLKCIPYGKTMSYYDLARRINSPGAARAVGQALKKNPWPILLPCHRVIGKNGKLGGFSSGAIWKKMLLSIEGSMNEDE